MQGTLLARCLELGHELTAAVALDRPQRKRRAFLQACEEVGSGACSGHRVDFNDIPARNDVTGGEVLENDSRQGAEVQGVHLHDVPGLTGLSLPQPYCSRSSRTAWLSSVLQVGWRRRLGARDPSSKALGPACLQRLRQR